MAYCSNCGTEIPVDAKECPGCKAVITGVQETATVVDPWDHTAEFDAKDISENKVYALIAYCMGLLGVVIAILCAKDSPYVKFHCRESAKINLTASVIGIITGVLCWTCIVPIAGIVLCCILFVVDVIAFIQVCNGKAKEPWLIRSIGALH